MQRGRDGDVALAGLPSAVTWADRLGGVAAVSWRRGRRRPAVSKAGLVGGAVMLLIVALALIGPAISPYDPIQAKLSNRLLPPSAVYFLGTDGLGRDILSRLLHGGRIALQAGLISVTMAGTVGTLIGLASGYYGGHFDRIMMSCIDVLLAFPYMLLALLIVTALGPGLTNAIIAVAIVQIPQFARLTRGTVLAVKVKEYVVAAQALGVPGLHILFRHVFPNSVVPLIVLASLSFGAAIVSTATLSFLGLGAQPPTPEWGAMLSNGREYMRVAPWVATFPGLAILVLVIACNLLGDGLRDAGDPRAKA